MPKTFDVNKSTARNRATQKHKNDKLKELTATLKIIGSPLLRAGQLVEIKNVATMHEGTWRIVKVTHTIGRDGYTTVLELDRNATNMPATATSTNALVDGNGLLNAKTEIPQSAQPIKTATGEKLPLYDQNGNRVQ